MTDHLLIRFAERKPYKTTTSLLSTNEYDDKLGYRVVDGKPFVVSPEYTERPAASKKCDQETGEDIKGE